MGYLCVGWRRYFLPFLTQIYSDIYMYSDAQWLLSTVFAFKLLFYLKLLRHDYDCAQECLDYLGGKCKSFDYEVRSQTCHLHAVIEGTGVFLRESGMFHNYELLGSGHSAWFHFENLPLIQGAVYYINARITNAVGK